MLKFKNELEEKDILGSIKNGLNPDILLTHSYHIEFLDPKKLLNTLGLSMKSCKESDPAKIVSFIISQGGDSEYDWLGLLINPLPPVIIVDNTLKDGIHRCVAAVATKSLVYAAVFSKK